jgi:hypothetical protein
MLLEWQLPYFKETITNIVMKTVCEVIDRLRRSDLMFKYASEYLIYLLLAINVNQERE